jgi:hypothetical protein
MSVCQRGSPRLKTRSTAFPRSPTARSWIDELRKFAKAAVDAYRAKLTAENTADKIAADLAARELALEERERALATRVLIAEQGNAFTRAVRPLWALPFVIYTWKVIIFDKVLALGSTDPLTGFVATLAVTVAAAYFGGHTLENVARIIKR